MTEVGGRMPETKTWGVVTIHETGAGIGTGRSGHWDRTERALGQDGAGIGTGRSGGRRGKSNTVFRSYQKYRRIKSIAYQYNAVLTA